MARENGSHWPSKSHTKQYPRDETSADTGVSAARPEGLEPPTF